MIKSDTVYYVNCDKCDTQLTHIFNKFTFEEEYQFDSIEECHHIMKRHGWLMTEAGNCYCPKCSKEIERKD